MPPTDLTLLMKKYKIEFEKPIAPDRWPRDYRDIFSLIRKINRVWMEDYEKANGSDILPFKEKQERVAMLVNAANSCLRKNSYEAEWRDETENKVFARFFSEVVCRSCRDYLWLSEYQAWPSDEAAVRKLQERREKRTLCRCGELKRARVDIHDNGRVPIFSYSREKVMEYEDVEAADRAGLQVRMKKQQPDRVIGLGLTRTLEDGIRFRTGNGTPFRGGDAIYPFIVVEAKAESGDGFKSVEHQSAFPIRTCLKLQQNLRQETGVDLQCLVWFFAFRGEEWRLYAAVPENDKTRVIDLWHGTILSEDGALQLCLIVDCICNWARDVYRENIIACLAAGRELFRRLTTPFSSHQSEADAGSRWELESLTLRASQGPELGDQTPTGRIASGPPESVREGDAEDARQHPSQEDAYQWLRWVPGGQDLPPWTRKATIRHSNLVLLSHQALILPDDGRELRECLNMCFPGGRIEDAARRLLSTLLDVNTSITTSSNIVLRRDHQDGGVVSAVKAFIHFRTFLRPADWQIERQLLYITCSAQAVDELLEIGGPFPLSWPRPTAWEAHECECVFRVRLHLLSGKESAASALSERHMCLKLTQQPDGQAHFEPVRFFPGAKAALTKSDLGSISEAITKFGNSAPFMTEHRTHYRVTSGEGCSGIPPALLDLAGFRPGRGVLLKKPPGWPAETPEFCFLAMDEQTDFRDTAALADRIQESRDRLDVFGTDGGIRPADTKFLDQWPQVLQGALPETTLL